MAISVNGTKLTDLVNPQVMADMISAELPNAIRFAPLAVIGTRLKGRAGDTLTMPKYGYIGDAAEVAEGEDISIAKMSTSTTQVKVKKAGKGIEITDEAVLSGYGDPVAEGKNQLKMSIANKIDNDCLAQLKTATLSYSTAAGNKLTASDVVKAKAKFGEKLTEPAVLAVNSNHYADLILDDKWVPTEKGVQMIMDGVVGSIGGCQVIVSDKLADTEAFIIKQGGLGIELKRNVMVESDRDIIAKLTVITADEHYVAYLKDETKVVKITITA